MSYAYDRGIENVDPVRTPKLYADLVDRLSQWHRQYATNSAIYESLTEQNEVVKHLLSGCMTMDKTFRLLFAFDDLIFWWKRPLSRHMSGQQMFDQLKALYDSTGRLFYATHEEYRKGYCQILLARDSKWSYSKETQSIQEEMTTHRCLKAALESDMKSFDHIADGLSKERRVYVLLRLTLEYPTIGNVMDARLGWPRSSSLVNELLALYGPEIFQQPVSLVAQLRHPERFEAWFSSLNGTEREAAIHQMVELFSALTQCSQALLKHDPERLKILERSLVAQGSPRLPESIQKKNPS